MPNSDNPDDTFVGWYTDEDLTTPYVFDTPVTSDITLYPKFENTSVTVTFEVQDPANDTNILETQQVVVRENENLVKPEDNTFTQVPDGYEITGWRLEGDPTGASVNAEDVFNALVTRVDQTYIAILVSTEPPPPPVDNWVVTFEDSDFSDTTIHDREDVSDGEKATVPPVPNSDNPDDTFVGWYTDEDLTTPYDFDAPVTGNITLYPKFERENANPDPETPLEEEEEDYQIDVIIVGNGTVTPDGGFDSSLIISKGANKTFYFKPGVGQSIVELYIDGKRIDINDEYIFTNVRKDHVIKIVFSSAHTNPSTGIR